MKNIVNSLLDSTINLKIFEGHRSDVVRILIIGLCIYQIAAPSIKELAPLDPATYSIILGILMERATKFAKEHKN